MPVAEDQFGIRADVHDGDEPFFMGQIHREHAGDGVGTHVPADDRQAIDAGARMDGQ